MTNRDADLAAVAALGAVLAAAENAFDADAAAALLTDDAVLMVPDFPVQEGKPACVSFLRDIMGWVSANFERHIAYVSSEVSVAGDMAFDRGTFVFTVSPKSGGESTQTTGKYLWLYRRTADGSWRVARLIVARDEESPDPSVVSGVNDQNVGCREVVPTQGGIGSGYVERLRGLVGGVELLQVPSVSVALRDDHGRVLMARHVEGNVWLLPGGAIEPAEIPADAAVREMFEETGLQVRITALLGLFGGPEFVVRYRNGHRTSYVMAVFEAALTGGAFAPDAKELLELRFVSEQDAANLPQAAWVAEVLDVVFRPPSRGGFRAPSWTPPPL